jgi:hypothetical protein
VLPYGYIKKRVREAQSDSPTAEVAKQELLVLFYDDIKKQSEKSIIEGITPQRVMAIAIVAFRRAIADFDTKAIYEGGQEGAFRRFMLLVLRRQMNCSYIAVLQEERPPEELCGALDDRPSFYGDQTGA